MPDSVDNRLLAELCRAGSSDAARQLFDRYVERLMGVARRRLSQPMHSRVDPEDIVQSVFRTFFGRLRAGEFQLDQQDDLCKLLVRITVHKTLQQIAYQKAEKRDPGHETGQEDEAHERILELLDREPDPEEAATFLDQLEHFLSRLRPQERQILELRVQGYSNEEIAEQLGTYDRKVRRVLERIRSLAEQDGWTPGN
jgi:RNA polymerase sigma factor (sigma-70 family)